MQHFTPIWTALLRRDSKLLRINARRLSLRNRSIHKPVLATHGPVVSITTHNKRVNNVHLALESIAEGSQLPSRLILWLDSEEAFKNRSHHLRRLEDRGLEILLSENYGPHTKYYPYLQSVSVFSVPLVIADDDCLYPKHWLKGLVGSFHKDSTVVSCYRAQVVSVTGKAIAPYRNWRVCRSSAPSFLHFATACSGCIYPPALLSAIKSAGNAFQSRCPNADDVWLHVQAVRAGFKIRQVTNWPLRFPIVPDTQDCGLFLSNVYSSRNDIQIQATYTPSDLDKLSTHRVST